LRDSQEEIVARGDEVRVRSIVDKLELNGFLKDYCLWSSELTVACPEFHLATALTCLSTCVGSKAVFWGFGGQRQWPNLYTLLLGPAGISRKTTSINLGRGLITEVEPQLIADGIQTRERFISYLAAQPTILWPIPEFSAVLGAWSRSYADGYKELITDWFDPEDLRHYRIVGNKKEGKENTLRIEKAAINILAGSTVEWLRDKLTEGDMKGGLMGRFLIFPHGLQGKDPGLNVDPDNEKRQALINYLKAINKMPSSFVDIRGVVPEINAWQKTAQRKLELNYNPDTVGFQSRAVTHTLKLAVLICISESPEPLPKYILTSDQLQKASLLGNWLINQMSELAETSFTKSRTESQIQKLLHLANGENGVRRSDAIRLLHCTSKEFDAIVRTAVQRKEIILQTLKGSTKPTLWYKSVSKPEIEF